MHLTAPLALVCLCSHADIPESSICYTGAVLESVIRVGREVRSCLKSQGWRRRFLSGVCGRRQGVRGEALGPRDSWLATCEMLRLTKGQEMYLSKRSVRP